MAETERPTVASRLDSLTGLRFVAALLVFVSHVAQLRPFADERVDRALTEHLTQLGWVGVSFFFVLSGFVLTWTARTGDTPSLFLRRRLTKIFPSHLVAWVVGVALVVTTTGAVPFAALPSAALLQGWVPDRSVVFTPNPPAWSLCAELLFYALFPLVLGPVRRVPVRRLGLLAAGLVLVIALLPLLARTLPDAPWMTYHEGPSCGTDPCAGFSWWHYWFVFVFPVSRVPEFLLGMVAARMLAARDRAPLGVAPAALLAVAAYGLALAAPDVVGMVLPTVVPLALVVVAAADADRTGRPSVLRSGPMVLLGEVSFAFYLLHLLVLEYGPLAAGGYRTDAVLVLVAGSLLVALVASWLLHRLVEVPAMRRWSRPRARATAAAGGR